jgi:acyl carrier protein
VLNETGEALPETLVGLRIAELRAHLRERLPEYMVPPAFVPLEALPISPAGKVDRKRLAALPAPEAGRMGPAVEYVAPRTPVEAKLVEITAGLLNLEQVGVNDNFFELGGHSLLATQLISRLREAFGVEVPLRVLFEQPTLAGLAEAVAAAQAQSAQPPAPSITAVSREARRMKRSDLK